MQNLKQNFTFWWVKYSSIALRSHCWEKGFFSLFYCGWCWLSLALLFSVFLHAARKPEATVRRWFMAMWCTQWWLQVPLSPIFYVVFIAQAVMASSGVETGKGEAWSLRWQRQLKLLITTFPIQIRNLSRLPKAKDSPVEWCTWEELGYDYPFGWIFLLCHHHRFLSCYANKFHLELKTRPVYPKSTEKIRNMSNFISAK